MDIVFGIAAILLIVAFGVGAVYLTWTNQRLKDAIESDPDTRKALSDRVGALEERQQALMNEIDASTRSIASLRGAFGALKKEWYRMLGAGAQNGEPEAAVDLDDLFSVHSQHAPEPPRKPRR